MGSSKNFLPKVEYHIENIKNKVFIADGAQWIWNWIENTYPNSTQIVDYFHAKEHLCDHAKRYFKEINEREKWINEQSLLILNKGVDKVIKNIEALPNDSDNKIKLLNY